MKNSLRLIAFTRFGIAAAALAATPLTAPAAAPNDAFGAERPAARIAPQVRHVETWMVDATPETVFPLLCPTLEYDWIPGWRARMVQSLSGVAEDGCIFQTKFDNDSLLTWVCTRFEPPTRIEYTCFADYGLVVRLKITLARAPEGTLMVWERTWHATAAGGEAFVAKWDRANWDAIMRRLHGQMDAYLAASRATGVSKH